jgi:hypothetical protein
MLEVRLVERVMPPHGCGGLANQITHVAVLERDLLEAQERPAGQCGLPDLGGVEAERGQWHAALDAPVQAEQIELKVDGRREVGVFVPDPGELGDLGRNRPRRTWRAMGHVVIVVEESAGT